MSPTCSSRFFVGRNARSATARTTLLSPCPADGTSHTPGAGRKRTPLPGRVATGNRSLNEFGSGAARGVCTCASRVTPVVCSARFGGLAHARRRATRACALVCVPAALPWPSPAAAVDDRQGRSPGQGRAGRRVPRRGRGGRRSRSSRSSPRARRCSIVVRNAGDERDPEHRRHRPVRRVEGRPERLVRPPDRRAERTPTRTGRLRRRPDSRVGPARASRQDLDPLERSSAYVNTYTLGPLTPNKEQVRSSGR